MMMMSGLRLQQKLQLGKWLRLTVSINLSGKFDLGMSCLEASLFFCVCICLSVYTCRQSSVLVVVLVLSLLGLTDQIHLSHHQSIYLCTSLKLLIMTTSK